MDSPALRDSPLVRRVRARLEERERFIRAAAAVRPVPLELAAAGFYLAFLAEVDPDMVRPTVPMAQLWGVFRRVNEEGGMVRAGLRLSVWMEDGTVGWTLEPVGVDHALH